MASTYLGFVLVDERPFFVLRYLDFAMTLPLMMLTLGLFSGTSIVETLYLTAASALMFASQLFCGLHPEHNRWSQYPHQLRCLVLMYQFAQTANCVLITWCWLVACSWDQVVFRSQPVLLRSCSVCSQQWLPLTSRAQARRRILHTRIPTESRRAALHARPPAATTTH